MPARGRLKNLTTFPVKDTIVVDGHKVKIPLKAHRTNSGDRFVDVGGFLLRMYSRNC